MGKLVEKMKVIKNINNNVSICQDSMGREVVAFGKGVGFAKPPYELDLSQIERTYYDMDPIYIEMINTLPEDILEISATIVDVAEQYLEQSFSSNTVFTLADHIQFSIIRCRKRMNIKLPIANDIEYLYEKEYEVGKYALKLIRKNLRIALPKSEAAYIAMHLLNSEEKQRNKERMINDKVIRKATEIIEDIFSLQIDRDGFNYSRFVSHMHYLFKRGKKQDLIHSANGKMYQELVREYPKTEKCAQKISGMIHEMMDISLTDEEKLYLILHINRLCNREDCYRE